MAALNDTLTSEIQRLKIAIGELGGDGQTTNCLDQQLSMNSHLFQMQRKQVSQLNFYKQQQQQQHEQQQNNKPTK